MMLLRIARVLSAIRASVSQLFSKSPNVLAAVRRRLALCFSREGELPWATRRLASSNFSRAMANEMPAGPYRPMVRVSRRPLRR